MKFYNWTKASLLILFLMSLIQRSPAEPMSINLVNADVSNVSPILAKLEAKSIVVSSAAGVKHLNFRNTSATNHEDLLKDFEKSLTQQGLSLVKVDEQTLKLVAANETNKLGNFPHIAIDVQTNSIVIDKETVAFSELWDAIKARMTPETEIWIHYANPEPRIRTPGKPFPSTTPPSKVVGLLYQSKVRPDKIFQLHLP